jgi:hypothetical protein
MDPLRMEQLLNLIRDNGGAFSKFSNCVII